MMTITPVRKHVTVNATADKAFRVFTSEMTRWWNPQYSLGTEALASVVLEPHEGGRWYERSEGGAECDWGRVAVWDPPNRVLMVWQINAEWRHDRQVHTELEVRFIPEGDRTRVELEHRGLEALGAQAESVRESFDGPGGWAGLLDSLVSVIDE